MSAFWAHVLDNPENTVSYGLDHVTGWFYTEFNSDDEPVVELDSMFTGLSKGKLLELLEKTDAPAKHLKRIALDLDPKA